MENRTILAAGLVAVLAMASTANASLLGHDAFLTGSTPANGEYAEGSLSGQGPAVSGFTNTWSSGGDVVGTSLSYSDSNYVAPTGGSIATTGAARWFRDLDAPLRSALLDNVDGTVYMSILANFGGGGASWGGYAAFELGTNGNDNDKALAIGLDGGVSGNFMYQINNGTKTSLGVASDSNTHLFLVKFDLSSTADSDAVTMWVDPSLGGVGDPIGGTTVSGLDLFAMNDFQIGTGASGNSFDELRFGTELVDVIPEPATLGLISVFGAGVLFVRRRFMI